RILGAAFGKNFISEVRDVGHPILSYLWNRVPWTRLALCDIADDIRAISRATNAAKHIRKLRDKEKCSEALHVLRHAAGFARVGFNVGIDPKVNIKGTTKMPDLVVRLPKYRDKIYV